MADYMTQMLEAEASPSDPVSIWEVSFECDISPEGDLMEDCLDISAFGDGSLAIAKARKHVLSDRYMRDEAGHVPTKFVLKGLRLLATSYVS